MGWAQGSVGGWGFAALALGVHVPKWLSDAANLPLDKTAFEELRISPHEGIPEGTQC